MLEVLATLPGLVDKHPVHGRRLRDIRRAVYRRIGDLDVDVIRSVEPIPFAEIDTDSFRPISPGAVFGGALESAWLRIRGHVPQEESGTVAMLGIRGEGLVYSADGDVLDSTSTVWIQGDLPHAGGKFRAIRHELAPGTVELYADIAFNGFLFFGTGKGVFHGAHLAARDDAAQRLYYDYLTLFVLAVSTEDAALAGELDGMLAAAHKEFANGDVHAALTALAGPLSQPSHGDFAYSAIGHGHLDMAWVWPLRETRRKAARTYTNALNTIERHPGYIYGTSQPQQLAWMQRDQPAIFERVKDAVASGRIEPQGGFWVEPDTNLPNGESLVRQALVGRRFWSDELGVPPERMRLCWLPDTFGYSGNLPQILSKSGMDWFLTIKLAWNRINVFPHRTFRWAGIDGSSVLVHMPPEGDYNSRGAADGLLRGIHQYPEKDLGSALLVYGAGDGGGGPGEVHLEVTERERSLRGLPTVEPSTAHDFFEKLDALEIAHTHSGELYLETHQGTYTTQGAIKRLNRVVERKLHNAEALAVLTGSDSRLVLEQHWRDVLLNQFHDIIPGSSIERVNREAVETYERIERDLDRYAGELVGRLPREDAAPSAVNLTSFPRDEHVRVADRWHRAHLAPYSAGALTPADATPELRFSSDAITNGLITVRFGVDGEIVSFRGPDGAEASGDGLNRLVLHRDPFQFPFDAWDIDQGYHRRTPRTLTASEVETRVDGPTVRRRHIYRFSKSVIEQDVVLEAGSPLVRFETRVDWHESHKMLRAEFRPTRYADSVRCEIQFGHIERVTTERDSVEAAQFEVCAHKWIATEDEQGGFALLNDSKYGHRAKNGLLSLNLLRSPTFPDKTADRGIHRFVYAMMPFESGDLASVVREGYRLNNPLLIADGAVFDSALSTSDPGVVIETVKPAERGEGVIVRLYESLGRATTTELRTTLARTGAVETDLLERVVGPADLGQLTFTPFEIKTILLERS